MDWSTIPVELLERILVFSQSPKAVGNALIACKTWRDVDHDKHLWQDLYQNISGCRISGEPAVDWKKKVTDLVLVRKNVKDGRCVVRTLATSQGVRRRTTLDIENPSVYKDYFLCGWLQLENYGSYGGVSRHGSHVIDVVKEEAVKWTCEQVLFMNQYVASTPSNYYGGAMCSEVKVQKFDPEKNPTFTPSDSVRFNMQPQHRNLVRNYCPDSNYIGFTSYTYGGSSSIKVINAESGNIVCSLEGAAGFRQVQLYDAFLVMSRAAHWVEIIDVRTATTLTTQNIPEDYDLGFMTGDTLAIRTEGKIILWNFIENTEVVYPAGQVPMSNIEMMYHDMWLVYDEGKLSFYATEDGALINTLALRAGSKYDQVSLLSDDRICVATRNGCRVISFIDSEVNRKIEVELMDIDGTVTTHEISVHELPKFFVEKAEKPYEMMISRVVKYPPKETNCANERFVLICTQDEKNKTSPENAIATKLLQTEIRPTCVNTPYQAWKFDNQVILVKDFILDRVCGRAILVREVKINGRWQLASMSE